MKKKNILIGMMGSGKTTIGKKLAKILNLDFIDTDKIIEKDCKIKINKIFEKFGESFFRKKEEKVVLKLLSKKKSSVIALGGGAFLNKKVQKKIIKENVSIWLDVSLEAIYKRCKGSNQRPLLNKKNNSNLKKTIKELMQIRKPIYSKAKFVIKTNKSTTEVCKKILFSIKNII